MRIISGKARGLKLKALQGLNTRPTSDRVKESLFNIIAPLLHEAKVLDLFSGTGNLAIESLSRNASFAYLVDNYKPAIEIIKENIDKARFNEKVHILNEDVLIAIKKIGNASNIKFDIIFMDPPYLKGFIIPCLNEIMNNNILEEDGIIIVEHDVQDELDDYINSLKKFKEKKYGNTMISFFSKEAYNGNSNISR